jgi:hypothetical protein
MKCINELVYIMIGSQPLAYNTCAPTHRIMFLPR